MLSRSAELDDEEYQSLFKGEPCFSCIEEKKCLLVNNCAGIMLSGFLLMESGAGSC